jgi:hypothetical protein
MKGDLQAKLNRLLENLQRQLPVRFFSLEEIPQAVVWAERGGIAVHENFHTKRRYAFHVICAQKERLEKFCRLVDLPVSQIKASEFYRFWHLTWVPFTPPVKKKRPRGRPPKRAL